MKKTVTANIGGTPFILDDDAYIELEHYLSSLRSYYKSTEDSDEILNDIEIRISELLLSFGLKEKVVSKQHIAEVRRILGEPEFIIEDDENAQQKTNSSYSEEQFDSSFMKKQIYRDTDDRVLGGVCSGISHFFGIRSIWVRLITLILVFFFGLSIFVYIILWIIIPPARTSVERSRMRGESFSLKTIEREVKEEWEGIKSSFKKKKVEGKYEMPSAVKEIGNTFLQIVKVIAFIFLAIIVASFVLFPLGLALAIFAEGNFVLQELNVIFEQIFENNLRWEVVIVSIIGVAIGMIYGLVSIFNFLFNSRRRFPTWSNITIALLFACSLFGLISTGVYVGSGFQYFETESQVIPLTPTKDLLLDIYDLPNWYTPATMEGVYINEDRTNVGFGHFNIQIIRDNETEFPKLQIDKEVSAKSPAEANKRLNSFQYAVKQDSNTLYLAPFYQFTEGEMRAMDVDFKLILPDSVKVNTTLGLESKIWVREY